MYDHATVQQAIGCSDAHYRHWVQILGSTADQRPLTPAEAVAIAAVAHLQSSGVARKKLERPFARLAFQPPTGTEWLVVSEPRKGVQIIEAPLSRDLGWRTNFRGHIFDPAAFLATLDG